MLTLTKQALAKKVAIRLRLNYFIHTYAECRSVVDGSVAFAAAVETFVLYHSVKHPNDIGVVVHPKIVRSYCFESLKWRHNQRKIASI